jgi:hypothetical protein
MDAKEEEIDSDQLGIDVGMEILGQVTKGLVNDENVNGRGKIMNKITYPAHHLSVGAPFQDQEDACTQGITPEQRPPEWNVVPKEEN